MLVLPNEEGNALLSIENRPALILAIRVEAFQLGLESHTLRRDAESVRCSYSGRIIPYPTSYDPTCHDAREIVDKCEDFDCFKSERLPFTVRFGTCGCMSGLNGVLPGLRTVLGEVLTLEPGGKFR